VLSRKPIFGYPVMVAATPLIALRFGSGPHTFTVGRTRRQHVFANLNNDRWGTTGIKIFNWWAHYGGKIRLEMPMIMLSRLCFQFLIAG